MHISPVLRPGLKEEFLRRSLGMLSLFSLALLVSLHWPIPREKLAFHPVQSMRICDRDGLLLREVLSPRQGYGRWIPLTQVPKAYLDAVIATEDSRFFSHPGVSPLALIRALRTNLSAGRIVSGGSTLTQQVIRQLYPIRQNLAGKIYEIWLALRLEHTLSKPEILEQYVNRVPFGNSLFGVEAAARHYFNRPAAHLSLAQAAFLAGLPQAPSRFNPLRNITRARHRQLHVLRRLRDTQMIDAATFAAAVAQPVTIDPASRHFLAPHAVDMLLAATERLPARALPGQISLTLDAQIQTTVERLIRTEIQGMRRHNVTNAAAVVIDNASGEIRALVGSNDYFDSANSGQVNGALSLRQPGSALKPFTYLLALEQGFTPASLLPDVPLHAATASGDFSPQNYDNQFHGPVRLRTALACSYNVPAVYLAEQLGIENLLDKLHTAGFVSLRQAAAFYGPGLTLGNGEVSLLELTRAYAGLANGGVVPALHLVREIEALEPLPPGMRQPVRFAEPESAALVADMLADEAARVPAFGEDSPLALPFPCASKTGTTKDYRDNWTVGFTSRYTVGVWVGNFDGSPMQQVSGISGAGPIFRDLMLSLHGQQEQPAPFLPAGLETAQVCALSGDRPTPLCPGVITEKFQPGTAPTTVCTMHLLVRRPEDGNLYVAVTYPPRFRAWARSHGFADIQYLGRFVYQQAGTPRPAGAVPPRGRIAFPDDGDVFKIDPVLRQEFQKLRFAALAPAGVEQIVWVVDGKRYAAVSPPFAIDWPLTAGRHTLAIRAVSGAGAERDLDRVRFRVLP